MIVTVDDTTQPRFVNIRETSWITIQVLGAQSVRFAACKQDLLPGRNSGQLGGVEITPADGRVSMGWWVGKLWYIGSVQGQQVNVIAPGAEEEV